MQSTLFVAGASAPPEKAGSIALCEGCGWPVHVFPGGNGGGRPRRYCCSRSCAIAHIRSTGVSSWFCEGGEWRYSFSDHGRFKAKRGEIAPCVVCGVEFLKRSWRPDIRHCSPSCAGKNRSIGADKRVTKKNGARHVNPQGYVNVWCERRGRYIGEHRMVMERAFGRDLESWEQVHHINGDRSDNRLENLQLRVRNHGAGQVPRCRCCGSQDIEWAEIA